MTPMPVSVHWGDAVSRLALTLLAGILLGYNRSEHGKAAGMRTVVLVALAASVAMLQMNALLATSGRASDSFVMNDLMRLPLGILTGVGFIGGGAILHRESLVTGVTTAATLWLATVIGLCLGGGQIALGVVAICLGLFTLWVLQWIEQRLRHERHASLSIESDTSGPGEAALRRELEDAGLAIVGIQVSMDNALHQRKFDFVVRGIRHAASSETPGLISHLAHEPGIRKIEWKLDLS
jgi:putative Mg2+ transporter-C (MgtC) family protein